MAFLYNVLLKLLYPTSLALLLLLVSAALKKRELPRRICFWLAIAVLLICGNGWVAEGLTRHLERECSPPNPVPKADCIIILSGGTLPKISPRPTIEVDDAGDRVLYGAYLFRQGKAARIICTGNVSKGSIAPRAAAEDMAELLEGMGVPKDSIILETKAENTREHGLYLQPLLQERGFKRVLVVTSATHMPRALGVFKRYWPGIELIPAPTDFHFTDAVVPWHRQLSYLIPTPRNLLGFSGAMHEYFGMLYYRLRGWL